MDRREYLGIGASLGAAALAGCGGFVAAANAPAPAVPTDRLESGGWQRTAEDSGTVFEETYGPVTVEAVQHTLRYEDAALRADIAGRTLGQIDTALSVWFASRVDFSPNLDNLPGGVGQQQIVDRVRTNARDQFEQQMENQGLSDIRKSGEGTIEIDTGETAETVQLSAVYPFEGITFQVTEGERVEIPPTDIGIEAVLAVWHHGDYTLISGGAYPAQNFENSIESDLSEGITVSVDIDLGLEPAAYREEVRSLIAGVE
ncbi:hypothetical protein [Haloarcula litorea]|uniref:hypothetical protein n=1 Tax=Haloarcula litorea TaxID=3032579 RepID=UPI0023E890E2|nr:hypothetical protein [Halomicroarcula sp. GDY20]